MVFNKLGTRFGINDKRGTLVMPELSHEDLAEVIGSSRPMVSKLIGDIIEEGLLERGEKRHFILQLKEKPSTGTSNNVLSPIQPMVPRNRLSARTSTPARDDPKCFLPARKTAPTTR